MIKKSDMQLESICFDFTVSLLDPINPQYFVKVISDRWLNSETQIPISFKQLILPSKFPACTQLHDMQLIPLNHFSESRIKGFLKSRSIEKLNSIQTQVYTDMFESFKSVFIGAPGNSGKTVAVLLLIGKLLMEDYKKVAKAIYILPFMEILERKRKMLEDFADFFDRKIGFLTGVTNTDIQILERSHFIVGIAEHWDNLTRRWQTKRIKK